MLSVVVVAVAAAAAAATEHLHWYGVLAFGLFGWKVLTASLHQPFRAAAPAMTVAVIIPTYNEDPAYLVAGLRSLLTQTRRPDAAVVIDDGSSSPESYSVAHSLAGEFADAGVRLTVLRQPNAGKREALATGFRAEPDVDAYLCVDSDTILDDAAMEEALRPFADPRVTAVTGLVLAANHSRNLLTRLVDMRYACAFLIERAAYSAMGAVLCCCGSLAVYRADVVHRRLDAFLGQRFLGQPAVFGDDRHMTNLCLLDGRAVFQETAVAHTAVPERFGHYLRQQVRWNKSFFRESLWVIRKMPAGPAVWLTMLELGSWLVFTTLIVYALTWRPFHQGLMILAGYVLWVGLMGWVRSVRALSVKRAGVGWQHRALAFTVAPLYGLLHVLVLVPLRLYSLVTLRSGTWGTREGGAEVTLHEGDAAAAHSAQISV